MKKKIILLILGICFLMYSNVKADMLSKARIGNNYYDTLEEAIANAESKDIIYLTSDNSLDKTIVISKNVNINLNNHNISALNKVFLVRGGSLNLTGKGKVRETKPYYGAVVLIGSEDDKKDYSTLSISEDVILEGWSGVFIDHGDNNKSYGVLVNMNGQVNALNDIDGDTGIGIYVNGNIQHTGNVPVINLGNTSNIKSTGFGVYSAGNANFYINGGHIEGVEAGLGIKAGMIKVLDGEILGTGPNKIPTSGNNNGINPTGAAVQIESNNKYYGNIVLDFKNGLFQSKNSHVIYEYTVNDAQTKIKDISLSGGKYVSLNDSDVFKMSDSFNGMHTGFVSGGQYSSSPSSYLIEGHSVTKQNHLYDVVSSEIGGKIPLLINSTRNNYIDYTIILSIILVIGIYLYLRFFRKNI